MGLGLAANEAREKARQTESDFNAAENAIKDLEKKLGTDYGTCLRDGGEGRADHALCIVGLCLHYCGALVAPIW